VFSKFVYNFKEENLKVGLISGNIELENLTLKHDQINELFAGEG